MHQPLHAADEPPPDRRAAHAEVGAGDRAVERVGHVAEPRPGRRGDGGRPGRGQGRRRPVSATARTARPTAARWAAVGIRHRGDRRRPAFVGRFDRRPVRQVQPAQRVGPQPAPAPHHRPAGRARGPVPVGPLGRLGHRRHPGGRRRGRRPAGRRWRGRGRPPPGGPDHSPRLVDTTASTSPESRRSAACRSARSAPAGGAGRPSRAPGRRRSRAPARRPDRRRPAAGAGRRAPGQIGRGQPVGLVEHDDGHVAVAVELAQVAGVHHPVGVLLRVDHPDDQVDEAEQPVDLQPVGPLDRVEVGQVEQHQPAQRRPRRRRRARSPGRSGGGAARRSSRAAWPRRPGCPTRRRARRRWSGAARRPARASCWASALNRLDLPLPVAPASATTVWSRDSASRVPARSTTVCAATSRSAGRWPSTASRNRWSAGRPGATARRRRSGGRHGSRRGRGRRCWS